MESPVFLKWADENGLEWVVNCSAISLVTDDGSQRHIYLTGDSEPINTHLLTMADIEAAIGRRALIIRKLLPQ